MRVVALSVFDLLFPDTNSVMRNFVLASDGEAKRRRLVAHPEAFRTDSTSRPAELIFSASDFQDIMAALESNESAQTRLAALSDEQLRDVLVRLRLHSSEISPGRTAGLLRVFERPERPPSSDDTADPWRSISDQARWLSFDLLANVQAGVDCHSIVNLWSSEQETLAGHLWVVNAALGKRPAQAAADRRRDALSRCLPVSGAGAPYRA